MTTDDRANIERGKGEAAAVALEQLASDYWTVTGLYPDPETFRWLELRAVTARATAIRGMDKDVLRVTVSERDATIARVRRALSDGEDDWDGRPGLLFDVLSAIAVALDGSPDPDASEARS